MFQRNTSTIWRIVPCALIWLALLAAHGLHAQEPLVAVLTIVDKQTGLPLQGASLVCSEASTALLSDSTGAIHLPSALSGREFRAEISMVGYQNFSIRVRNPLERREIALVPQAAILDEVLVTNSNPYAKVNSLQMGSELITAMEAKTLPAIMGEVDVIKVLQLKPGVKNAGEGLAGFYVRGGAADQNLILLDGVPVYNPNHLLGLFSVFNNDAIRDARLYKSAFPARYGGRLSSVLDISSRAGSMDSMIVSGGAGVLSSRLSVEAPLRKGVSSVMVSGRRTYFDLFTKAVNRTNDHKADYQQIPDYFFSDLNFRADWKTGDRSQLWATGYLGADNFKSDPGSAASTFRWGNRTASLNWKSRLPSGHEVSASAFYSGYQYQLGNEYDFNEVIIRSAIKTAGARWMLASPAQKTFIWQTGLQAMKHTLNIGDFKSSSQLSSFESGERTGGNEWAAFFNTEWDRGGPLALSGGMRLSAFHTGDRWYVNPEPRIVVRLNTDERSALKASYTRMFQYLHQASLSSSSLPVDMWYPSTARTRPQFSDQLSLGWSRALGQAFFLNVEGYYKWMYNQVEFRDGANLIGNPRLENEFVYGKGLAYGVETYIEKKVGQTRGWIGYTWAKASRRFDAIDEGLPFRPRYDRRHDVSLVLIHRINGIFTVSGNWIFGTGAYTTVPIGRYVFQNEAGVQPRSIIPVYERRNNYQLSPVHRLDVNLVMALPSKHGRQDITLSLYNAYSRRNPFYIEFTEVDDKEGYITAIQPRLVSLFPLLPGITYNFKF